MTEGTIELACPRCKKAQHVKRYELDPPRAVRMVLQCPNCNPGDFAAPSFFAADGTEVNFEEGLVRDILRAKEAGHVEG